jgi:hypothetical protein
VSENDHLAQKVIEFKQAMDKYVSNCIYQQLAIIVSTLILGLQFFTLFNVIHSYHEPNYLSLAFAFFLAYLATDFINGLAHLIMDNATHYTSPFGPFIAAFHFHHARQNYAIRHPIKVYFYESGTKFWLLIYLIALCLLQFYVQLNTALNFGLVCVGILSSVAEVSHYCCHNATVKNTWIKWLQKNKILLSMDHHKQHHCSDNTQYAFLNGISDPLLNTIARVFYAGYKNHADKHTAAYIKTKGNYLPYRLTK